MGYYGKLEEKLFAQELRKQGLSYSQIRSKVTVSKDTLSRWCRDIPLTDEQINNLSIKRTMGGLKGSIIGAKNQQKRRIEETLRIYKEGKLKIGLVSKRERFIAGVALYLAEGTKADRVCAFSNSDPYVIQFMTNWFTEFCNVTPANMRGAIWLHEELSEKYAKEFWSKVTGISHFHKTYIARNKSGSKKIRKNIHKYGVFSIRFSSATIHRTIIGWIAGLLGACIQQ